MMYPDNNNGGLATIPDRIRGCIAIFLCIASLTWGCNTDDRQWQVSCIIAGIFYMMTALVIVFEKYDQPESRGDD